MNPEEKMTSNKHLKTKYDWESRQFYKLLITPCSVNECASMSGGGKSMFLGNLAVAAAFDDQLVGIISCEMNEQRFIERLRFMVTDYSAIPMNEKPDLQQFETRLNECREVLERINLFDLSAEIFNTKRLLTIVKACIDKGIKLIIIDGADIIGNNQAIIAELFKLLAVLASQFSLTIWVSSQITRPADSAEIVRKTELAWSADKEHRASIVLTLGHKVNDQHALVTACLAKDRHKEGEQEVFRLYLTPSLRMRVMTSGGELRLERGYEKTNYKSERINSLPGDFPNTNLDDSEGDDLSSGDIVTDSTDNERKGAVGIGRGVFQKPMYHQKDPNIFILLYLYQAATYKSKTMYAPNTHVPINLKRGQYMTSLRSLSQKCGVSIKTIRTFLKSAQQQGLLTIENVRPPDDYELIAEGTTKGTKKVTGFKSLATVITLSHYAFYPKDKNADKDQKGTTKGTRKDTTGAQ